MTSEKSNLSFFFCCFLSWFSDLWPEDSERHIRSSWSLAVCFSALFPASRPSPSILILSSWLLCHLCSMPLPGPLLGATFGTTLSASFSSPSAWSDSLLWLLRWLHQGFSPALTGASASCLAPSWPQPTPLLPLPSPGASGYRAESWTFSKEKASSTMRPACSPFNSPQPSWSTSKYRL